MKLYTFLNRVPVPRSYVGKLLVICFFGTHAPLIVFAAYALIALPLDQTIRTLAGLILLATLGGTAVTLFLVRGLLSPILVAERSLRAYLKDRTRPNLPTTFRDEAGALMAAIQCVVDHLEGSLGHLERLATTDPLTSAGNRRWLDDRGAEALAAARQMGQPVSAIVFDVDHFKRVNDTYGHATGDEVLVQVVRQAQATLKPEYLLARIGGEEFCILLPGADLDEAISVAERIRSGIARSPIPTLQERTVTASFGTASVADGRADLSDLIHEADECLYTAKRTGRNRVCSRTIRIADPSSKVVALRA